MKLVALLVKVIWPILKPEVQKIWKEEYEKAKRVEADTAAKSVNDK